MRVRVCGRVRVRGRVHVRGRGRVCVPLWIITRAHHGKVRAFFWTTHGFADVTGSNFGRAGTSLGRDGLR